MKRKSIADKNAQTFAYILSAIDGDNYGKTFTNDVEKLQFLADCFKSEYVCEYNIKRYGNYTNMFAEWLKGLPSSFNVDFENYRIIEIAKEWGAIPQDATESQEDKILSNWWNWIANKTFQLMKRYKVLPH